MLVWVLELSSLPVCNISIGNHVFEFGLMSWFAQSDPTLQCNSTKTFLVLVCKFDNFDIGSFLSWYGTARIVHTVYKKHHGYLLRYIIGIGDKPLHLENWARRIFIQSFYLHQTASNWHPINWTNCINPWYCGNRINICSSSSMLIIMAAQKALIVILE